MFDTSFSSSQPRANSHQFDSTGQAVRDKEARRFDGKLHNSITNAKTVGEWEKVADTIVKAAKVGNYREPHGLRDTVLERFLEGCPFGPVKRRYYDAVNQPANRREPEFSMLGHLGKPQKKGPPADRQQKMAKRRAQDQMQRNAMRGSTNGGGQKPGRQKGGKK